MMDEQKLCFSSSSRHDVEVSFVKRVPESEIEQVNRWPDLK